MVTDAFALDHGLVVGSGSGTGLTDAQTDFVDLWITPQSYGAVEDLDDAGTRAANDDAFEAMWLAWSDATIKPLIIVVGTFYISDSISPSGRDVENVRDMTGLSVYCDVWFRTKGDAATNYMKMLAWDGTDMSGHTFQANEPWDGHPRWQTVATAGDWDKPTTADSYRDQYCLFNAAALKENTWAGKMRLQQGTIQEDLCAWGTARAITGQGAMHSSFLDVLIFSRFRAGFVTQPKSEVTSGDGGYQYPGWGTFCDFGHVYMTNVDRGLLAGPNSLDGTSFLTLVLNDNVYSISHRNVWSTGSFSISQTAPTWAPDITGAVDNGSGLVRLTATAHNLGTGQRAIVDGVVGTTEANGVWIVTKIDVDTLDLVGSSFANAYTSDGTVHRTLPGIQISEGSLNLPVAYMNASAAAEGLVGSSFHLTGGGKIYCPALKRDLNEDFLVADITVGTSINGELPAEGCDVWIGLDQIAQEHTTIPPGGIVELEAGATGDSNNIYIRAGIKHADLGVDAVTALGTATTEDSITLEFTDKKIRQRVDGGKLVFDDPNVLFSSNSRTTIDDTTTLADILNEDIPQDAVGETAGWIRVTLMGDCKVGGAPDATFQWKLIFGGTTEFDVLTETIPGSGGDRAWVMEIHMVRRSATTWSTHATLVISEDGSDNTGKGTFGTGSDRFGGIVGRVSHSGADIDTGAATLQLQVAPSDADALTRVRCDNYFIERG